MKIAYSDIDIHFTIDGVPIQSTNIVFEELTTAIPAHSHGSGCYEIHYISAGQGDLLADGQHYDIIPNTLYVTGPHVEHAQFSFSCSPMQEHCICLQVKKPKGRALSPLMDAFCSTPFWLGQDTQDVFTLMKQLFSELSHHPIGYQDQITLLLSQLIIYMVRNYQQAAGTPFQTARQHTPDANPITHKSIIIEKYFLFEYQNLSLKELARRLSLSPRQTQRLLMTCYNKTFQEKKAEARMSAAAILLGDKNLSISSVADALGYATLEQFSTAFRKYYGKSPREYRKVIPEAQ